MTQTINKQVEVNAFYFNQGQNFKSFPRAITLDHKRYTFQDGLRMVVKMSPRASHLSARDDFSSRSGLSRTDSTVKGASEKKIVSGAKKPAGSTAPPESGLADAKFVRFFDMTDGINNFRLRQEQDQWFLISRRPILR